MIENKITIKRVAESLQVSASTISKKLNGQGEFSVDELLKIRDIYFPHLTLEKLAITSINA